MPQRAHLVATSFHRGAMLGVRDVACSAPQCGCGPPEVAERAQWVLPRRGLFAWLPDAADMVVADSGSALLFRPERSFRVAHPVAGGDDCTVIDLSPELYDELGSALPSQSGLLQPATQLQHLRFHAACRTGPIDSLSIEEAALNLLASIQSDVGCPTAGPLATRATARHLHRRQAERVRLIIAADLASNVGLTELARAAGCSPFHLTRVFRAVTGLTIGGYRIRLRLAQALRLLADGADDLSGIAIDLGFTDQSHFTGHFRRAFGATPGSVRGKLRGLRPASGKIVTDQRRPAA